MKRIEFNKQTDEGLIVKAEWKSNICNLFLHNPSAEKVTVGEISIFSGGMMFSPDTPCYGEGYNKLAQYKGTVADFRMFAAFGDYEHYKLPIREGYSQCYNMITFSPKNENAVLMGFASSNRFSGIFRFNRNEFHIILNCEKIELQPGEIISLEQFFMDCGNKNELLEEYAQAIQKNHPMLTTEEIPTGWCSWLVYGPDITEKNIYDNMKAIKDHNLDLKYIQIDDGYQPYMGDWLSTTDKFDGGIGKICRIIKEEGFEPAIWVAPFIAEEKSSLFREHPDWFVKDEDGKPLSADRVTFRGWRCAPWYMLDGTNPEARKYLTHVFKVMREEWNIKYFKLDANMWGAMPFGYRYEKNRTCIEAYRMGMKAILEGAGTDSFILGCNAPMWASLGLVHGMRVTNDNCRNYQQFRGLAEQCFPRNWQNNTLWVNDPDTFVLANGEKEVLDPAGNRLVVKDTVTEDEFIFCASYVLASGGMALSSDDITKQTAENDVLVRKLLPPTGVAARFDDETYEVGKAELHDGRILIFIFNYSDEYKDYTVRLDREYKASDYWTGENLGGIEDRILMKNIPPHSAKVLECVPRI